MSLATREAIAFHLLVSPWIAGFALFTAGAMIFSIVISFTDWQVLLPVHFVGLKNYQRALFRDPLVKQSLKVTAIYTFSAVPLDLILAMTVAILMNQKVRFLGLWRTIYYLPAVIPSVAVAMLWMWIFNPKFGVLNWLLSLVGVRGPGWIYTPEWALPSLVLTSLWGIGGSMLIYLAGLQGIPTQLYESAKIDGAGTVKLFRYITLPMMTPVIFFNLVMGIIGSFQVFTNAFIMTNGGPVNATLFYVLYLYRQAFQGYKMGYGAALAWILFVIIISFTLLIIRSSAAWVFYEASLRKAR